MIPVRQLHSFAMTPAQAMEEQRTLAALVTEEPLDTASVRFFAGADVTAERGNPVLTGGVVVWDARSGRVVETVSATAKEQFPYIPGLLSFRETPVLLQCFQKLTTDPEVFFIDGHGRSHPRRLGIASHIGLLLNRPTIGVAKSRLCGEEGPLSPDAGSTAVFVDGGEEIGRLVRTRERSGPLYVSVGHRITLRCAVELVLRAICGYRLPEPTRLAHLYVNAVRRGEVWQPPQPHVTVEQERLF